MNVRSGLVMMVWLSFIVPTALAQENDPVESGARALKSGGSYPWYDPQSDELNPVSVRDSNVDDRNRHSQWAPSEWSFPDLSWMGEILLFMLYGLLAFALLAVIWWLSRLFGPWRRRRVAVAQGEDDEVQQRGDIDRIEALPYPILRQRGDLLEAARLAYQAGRFDDAIICLFSYLLVQLDRAQMLHLARGKTNRQYLRELGTRSPASRILEPTMVAFEDVFFGRYPLERERFESCWNRLDEFHAMVREAGA